MFRLPFTTVNHNQNRSGVHKFSQYRPKDTVYFEQLVHHATNYVRRENQTRMKNIGPVSRKWLAEIGIYTLEELRHVGAIAAYRFIKERYPNAPV